MKIKHNKLSSVLFFSLLILFILLRAPILINKAFPYTYDQGRDFLKVEEIVRYKNPTFIGPTTGIQGIYHGAWWYYYLSIPYILTNGNPIGFALWIFLTQLFITIVFFIFLKKETGNIPAFTFLMLVTFSSYFINMSSFVINSGFTFPFILLFFYSLYNLFKTKKRQFFFLTFLSVGFIWEAEFAFGVFLLPSLILTLIFTKKIKLFLLNRKNILAAFAGSIIPFMPRIAFEIKHNFIQTKTLLNFLFNPKLHNPKPLLISFKERLWQFINYYLAIFPDTGKIILGIVFSIMIILSLYYLQKKILKTKLEIFYKTIILLIIFLFVLSGFYRDNFWANYYEGIQFFFIILSALSIYMFYNLKKIIFKRTVILIMFLIFLSGIISSYKKLTTPIKPQGFYIPEYFVKKLYTENKNKSFCVKIYTPPVIPYTWDYLFKYYGRKLNTPEPSNEFIDGKCYFIIEDEAKGFEFRIKKWRKENSPQNSKLIRKEYKYGVTIELRKI